MHETLLGSYVDVILEGSRNLDKEAAGIRVLCLQSKDSREPSAVKDAGWVIFKLSDGLDSMTPGCGPSASITLILPATRAGGHQHTPLHTTSTFSA